MNTTGVVHIEDEFETELWDGTPYYAEYDYYQNWVVGNNEDYTTLGVSSTYAGDQGVAFLVMNYIEEEYEYYG